MKEERVSIRFQRGLRSHASPNGWMPEQVKFQSAFNAAFVLTCWREVGRVFNVVSIRFQRGLRSHAKYFKDGGSMLTFQSAFNAAFVLTEKCKAFKSSLKKFQSAFNAAFVLTCPVVL